MGIRGLTTFVNSRCDKFLEPYELHNTYLVIDGNNIASHLYRWHCIKNDCFGGDYDAYARCITKFFHLLLECKVTPLVIFDGSYEDRKLSTVYNRMRQKIKNGRLTKRSVTPRVEMFPLLLRDVFVEMVRKLNIKFVRCTFEADYDMACIARKLDCPLLSYDSDFFLFDVKYVPFSTLILNATVRKGIKSVQCQVYCVDTFVSCYKGLSKECLPLIAVLLGNDYIERKVFSQFYNHIKLPKSREAKSDQQRRIAAVIKFLQGETFESATKKVLGRIKMPARQEVAEQLQQITDGYICSNSPYFNYLFNPSVRDHFDDAFCMGQYPACFMDIKFRNIYFFIPQLEDYENVCSHQISLPLLAAIHKILTSGQHESLTYVSRNKGAGIKKSSLLTSTLQLPKLEEINKINANYAKRLLEDVVDFKLIQNCVEPPASCHLYLLAINYWKKNSTHKITSAHIYTLILSLFVLTKIDGAIGYYRSEKAFANKIKQNAHDEHVNCMRALIKYFKYKDTLSNNVSYFNLHIVDVFAQFQSCLMHLKYLNCLLNFPYPDPDLSDKYNGSFVYNMCSNLLKRNDPAVYLGELLKSAPSALKYITNMFDVVASLCGGEALPNNSKRKHRKRKNRTKRCDERAVLQLQSDSDDQEHFDENNTYSILNFASII